MRPSRIPALVLAVALPLLVPGPGRAGVMPVRKTALVTIPSRMELKAPPAKVWSAVCSLKGFAALTGFRPDPTAAGRSFARLGDHFRATMWTDKGTLVLTGLDPGRELRVTWEPDNAGYLCGKRILVTKGPAGSTLELLDRYTDDQPNVDETAKKVAGETAAAEAAFRALVEAK